MSKLLTDVLRKLKGLHSSVGLGGALSSGAAVAVARPLKRYPKKK